ncbi:MAG TPA: cation-translocating P-type ATPase [Arenicellales bacterium]|nr:cation-translocating P-type ATPase [Arenicellales bacterium]
MADEATSAAWHTLDTDDALRRLESNPRGLTAEEARRRLREHGRNVLPQARRRSLAGLLLDQFKDFMILVLLAAAVISGFIGEVQDTIAIIVIVLLNATIGAVQALRAEHALAALRRMSAPDARVLRDGGVVTVPAAELVTGDVVTVEAGDVVPADLRLLETEDLETDESALTGESQSVAKQTEALEDGDLPVGDRTNLAFKNTMVNRGRGRGVVAATGMDTEIGRIADLLGAAEDVRTPLQQRLARFGRHLALAVLAICAIVFIAGLLQGEPPLLMLLTAVSLAVAAIPEALPAVVTVSLALGARRLARQNALVRNLPAVETLGSVTYICADKTGTLTENRMRVDLFVVPGERREDLRAGEDAGPAWREMGAAMALNNDVEEKDGRPAGEATELALFEAARDNGLEKRELEKRCPRRAGIPFDSERKRMTTIHDVDGGAVVAYVKGAPETLVPLCARSSGGAEAFDREALLKKAEELAAEGYRVLAFARKELDGVPDEPDAEAIERDLTFLGFAALIDPPREEVPEAVADCRSAGITPVMITGDHPATALAIAARLGIGDDERSVITGSRLADMSDDELSDAVETLRVYARVSPEQKLRIIKALQHHGEFIAMTGDGVNDAPALKSAGIGVAMGMKGTDVARGASDMVLLDDNFATIVAAVRAGRRIYDNIRKFIKYTMTSNSGEIWTLFLAPFLGLPIPLLPIHILWINLVTDGLPGLAFAAERAEPGSMRRPPRPPDESIFAHGMWQHILWVGLFIGGVSLASQAWSLSRSDEHWQTVVFTVLTVSQLFHVLGVRSERESLFTIGLFSNPHMLGAVLGTLGLQLAVIYVPVLNDIFHTQPLPLFDLAVCLGLSSLTLVVVEIEKWMLRRGWLYGQA